MLLTFIVLGLVVLFLVVSLLKEKINVNENRIEVKDLVYPLFVSNDTIISITLLERLPKVLRRSNGLSLGRVLKGYYKIIKSMDFVYSDSPILLRLHNKAFDLYLLIILQNQKMMKLKQKSILQTII